MRLQILLGLVLLPLSAISKAKEGLCGKCWCSLQTHSLFCSSLNLISLPILHPSFGEHFEVIDISNNQLTSLNLLLPRPSRLKLRRLNAARNKINRISQYDLRHMTSLAYLDLSWNNIDTSLSNELLRDVTRLDFLSLSHNQIPCIKVGVFQNTTALTELDLSYNKLTSRSSPNVTSCFPQEAIFHLKNLIVLRISSNFISDVFESDGFFSCLPNLTLLEASNCGIKSISKRTFTGLHHLISVDLSDNSIAMWPLGALQSTKSLIYLDLGQNLLSKLPSDFLKGSPDLTHVQIRSNQFHTLDYKWLENFGGRHKQEVNLTQNEAVQRAMSFLLKKDRRSSSNINSSLASLARKRILYLDWSENPWVCDCGLITFIGWLIEQENWFADVTGDHDVSCYDTNALRSSARLKVYVDGIINETTLTILLNHCTKTSAFSSSTMDFNYDVTRSPFSGLHRKYNKTLLTTFTSKQVPNLTNFSDSQEQSFSPHLAAVIAILIIADVIAYLVIAYFMKKRLFCKFRRLAVAP